jgi:hypothetical protein
VISAKVALGSAPFATLSLTSINPKRCDPARDALGYGTGSCSSACQADPNCWCVEIWGVPYNRSYPAPWVLHLAYVATQILGDTSKQLDSPVPALRVLKDGAQITQGQTVYLTQGSGFSPPQMPALSASLVGAALWAMLG